jgi:hypothetical protein
MLTIIYTDELFYVDISGYEKPAGSWNTHGQGFRQNFIPLLFFMLILVDTRNLLGPETHMDKGLGKILYP